MWWFRLKWHSALRNAVNESVFAKIMFICQIKGEKIFGYANTFLITFFFVLENARILVGRTTLNRRKKGDGLLG